MSVEDKICTWLLKRQRRQLTNNTGHGTESAHQIGCAVGLSKKAVRPILERMAAEGLIRRLDYANGVFWRTLNPLPWEPGGEWPAGSVLPRPVPTNTPPIDLAYSQINALGGTVTDTDLHGKGYCQAIDDALTILTKLGAKDAPYAALLADAEKARG